MITALSIQIPEKTKGLRGFADRLMGDRVSVETRKARGVTLRHVIYTSYSGEVRLEKTDEAVGAQRDRILCSDKLLFPHNSGYKRFMSTAFSSRLCTNLVLSVLMRMQNSMKLKIGIYDPSAYCADFLLPVLERCADVMVVTSCFEPYFYTADRALSELGATAMITANRAELETRDLIIAPQRIVEPLLVSPKAVVLTVGKPVEVLRGSVFYKYRFKMPNGFDAIKPPELDEEYFCSALYTLGAQYELGSIVPLSAGGNKGERDVKTLADLLDNGI